MSPPEQASNAGKFPLVPLLIVLLLLGMAVFGDKGLLQVVKLKKQKTLLEEDIRRLEETNLALRKEIQALRSDNRTIEAIARKELGMVKEDELIYQFRTRDGDGKPESRQAEAQREGSGEKTAP